MIFNRNRALLKVRNPLVLSLFLLIYGAIGLSTEALAGLGLHGAKTVSTTNAILNEFTTLSSDVSAGSSSITVASSSLNANNRFGIGNNLVAGELVMIIQMQGATITTTTTSSTWGAITAYNNAGKFEFDEVASVPDGTHITLVTALINSYTSSGHVQVIRVPRYTTLTVNSGASITTSTWNGSTGGIVAIEVSGATSISGSIDVSGMGFRGGVIDSTAYDPGNHTTYASTDKGDGAEKGEGIAGTTTTYDGLGGRYARGAPANGGGGGNSHNCGGGGGSNGDNGITWNGLGTPDTTTDSNWKTGWDLEGGSFHKNTSSGGGRGGYSYNFKAKDPLVDAPGNSGWKGDDRSNAGGYGGRPLDNSGSRIYMGGGGGAGDQNNNTGGGGGNGGGLVYLLVGGTLSGSGTINANGADGTNATGNDAAGGAGGGGSVIIYTAGGSATGISINAKGGKGGDQARISNSSGEGEGPGGGGGAGYASVTTPNSLTITITGGKNGTTNSPTFSTFLPNGATMGTTGLSSPNPTNPYTGTVALPVTWIDVNAIRDHNNVDVSWITASEINNDYFTVEKAASPNPSKGGELVWQPIGTVAGAGNSNVIHHYIFIDDSPFTSGKAADGLLYYRVKQTDYNGRYSYSNIVAVNFNNSNTEIVFFPNPARDRVSVISNALAGNEATIEIYNLLGEKVYHLQPETRNPKFETMLDVSSLAGGLYIIQIISDAGIVQAKLMKE